MIKPSKTVALIYGGRGYESDVSLHGAENIRPIIEKKYNCMPIFIDKNGRWLIGEKEVFPFDGGFFCPDEGVKLRTDCAFPLLHGDFGEDGIIQGALECASIPYVGCSSKVGALCRDKTIVKAVAERLKIPTLPYLLALRGEDILKEAEEKIGYPAFIKPTSLGSSIGASPARDKDELIAALEKAFLVADRVIIERLIEPKRELECGYFSSECKELFTNAGEILSGGEFYDYEKKYEKDGVGAISSADIPPKTNALIKEYSARLVRALGIEGISRIDYFLSGDELYFNEINTMPGMTRSSLYTKMLCAEGVSTEEMIDGLVFGCLNKG